MWLTKPDHMKKLCFSLGVLLLCISCSKSSTTPTSGSTTVVFKFTLNGTNYNWSGPKSGGTLTRTNNSPSVPNTCSLVGYDSSTYYHIPGGADRNVFGLNFDIATSMLSQTVYPANLVDALIDFSESNFSGQGALAGINGSSATVTITSIHNGLYDGTFSGVLSSSPLPIPVVNITNGEFHNLKLIQQP